MGHLFCDVVYAFQAGFGPHTQEIMGIFRTTNQKPVIQISEVLVARCEAAAAAPVRARPRRVLRTVSYSKCVTAS
jgi:hypothetical protein